MNWRKPLERANIAWHQVGGPLLTLIMILVIEGFARDLITGPAPRPLPGYLGFSAIIAALLGGFRPGLASAALAWLYLYARLSPEAGRGAFLVVTGLAYPLVVYLVSLLRTRLVQVSRLEAERDAARTQAIELEALVSERTRALVTAQEAQGKQAERIRALYEVSALAGVSQDDQIHELLQRGCRMFGLGYGVISRFDQEDGRTIVTHVASAVGERLTAGQSYPFEETFGAILLEQEEPLAAHDLTASPLSELAIVRNHGVRACLGDLIVIDGMQVGLLSFMSDVPHAPFSATDVDLVRLMARWVGSTLERHDARLELETAYHQLQELSRLKDDFLSTISHEFRTPLTAIKAAAWILEQRLEGELNEKQEAIVSIVITHAEHLHRMIDDLLDLSKLESGEMRYKYAQDDLARLVREVSVSLSQLFADKHLELALELHDETVPACIDRDRIRQVLLNLLSNAAKFTSTGGKVTLRLFETAEDIRIEVEDTGIGIAQEHRERIFQKFFQVDSSSTRSAGGTGLGLAICKAIVEEGHGGSIRVESALSEGSTFIVTLPLVPEAQSTEPALQP